MRALFVSLFLLVAGCDGCGGPATPDAGDAGMPDSSADAMPDAPVDLGVDMPRVLPPFCTPPGDPPPEALRRIGDDAGADLFIGGRTHAPEGPETALAHGSFPVQVIAHPTLPVAYVASTGYVQRAVLVVDAATGAVLQTVDRSDAFLGLALSPDGATLYAAGGASSRIDVYAVDAVTGQLTAQTPLTLDGYPAGLAIAPDASALFAARFRGGTVERIPLGGTATAASVTPSVRPYDLLYLPGRNELWTTGYADTRISVIDATTFTELTTIDAGGGNPVRLVASPDEATVYASVPDGESVLAIDAATHAIRTRQTMGGEPGLVRDDGTPLPGTSPTGLALDAAGNRLYVARSMDDVVSVLDATTLAPLGSILVGWYPTDVALAGGGLLVTNGKGLGAGPIPVFHPGDESGKELMTGSIVRVDLATLDLAAATTRAEAAWRRTRDAYTYGADASCTWPVPAVMGGPSPIEHIVLIERENKTYDTDLGDMPGTDGDPSLVLFGPTVTPNLHALAAQFTSSDNFYSDGETSVQGHFWLTSSFVNDYIERTWLEDYRGQPGWGMEPASTWGTPDMGTFFTHLIHYGKSFRIYGEIIGQNGSYGGEDVATHLDSGFPGLFFDTSRKDEDKARYVARRIGMGRLDAFTYLLLPNDHTNGTGARTLSVDSMVSDNDYGTGLVVDAITHSPFWGTTAIFITEDDTQIGSDHVDYHRCLCVIVSPWAKHGHTSHVMTSFPSLFRTFELILGVPPMNRLDANATPFWNEWQSTPDMTPFTALPRQVPDVLNDGTPLVGRWPTPPPEYWTPDAVPDLGRRIWESRRPTPFPGPRLDEDDAAEASAYHDAWRDYLRYLDAHPEADPSRGW